MHFYVHFELIRFAMGDKMKTALSLALCFAALSWGCANLDERDNAVLGGAVGGAVGAAGGYEVGGRDGAIVGAGAGAATGVAVGTNRAVVEERRLPAYERDRRGYREEDRDDDREERRERRRRGRDD